MVVAAHGRPEYLSSLRRCFLISLGGTSLKSLVSSLLNSGCRDDWESWRLLCDWHASLVHVAGETATVRYRDLVDPVHLARVLNLDPGLVSRLHFRIRIVPLDPVETASQLTVSVAEQTNRVGAIDMPLTADLYRRNPLVTVQGSPASGASIGMELRVRSASGSTVPMSTINLAMAQYRQAAGKAAGPLRIFVPRLRTVVIRSEDPSTRCALQKGNRSTALSTPDGNGEIRFPIRRDQSDAAISCWPGTREILLES